MYVSVEMLLKFYAEKFSFRCTANFIREKSGRAHTSQFCNEEIPHWHSGYFTRLFYADRIHFALLNNSTTILQIVAAVKTALLGTCDETEKNDSLC